MNTIAAIGQVGDERGFGCTGTLVEPTVVLTAAHCINTDLIGAVTAPAVAAPHFQRVAFRNFPPAAADQLPALGVQAPNFAGASDWANDIGVMLLLAPPAPAISPIRIATPAQNLAAGSLVTMVGYGRNTAPLRNTALVGTAEVGPAAGDITATTYRYPESASGPAVIQQGDSGGPSLRFFFTPGFPLPEVTLRVVGVHSLLQNENPLASVDTRVNAFNGFLNGDGIVVNGTRLSTFTRYSAAGNSDFGTAASWLRGALPGVAAAPQDHDVVILNPGGAARTVTVAANTPDLEGLLNNQMLNVAAGNRLLVGGPTGVLNGGTLSVAARASFQAVKVDNVGTWRVAGTATVSGPARNSRAFTIEAGGSASVGGAFTNIRGATTDVGPGAAGNTATATFSGGVVNGGTVNVHGRGILNASAAAQQNPAQAFALFNRPEDGAAAATATLNILAGGQAQFTGGVFNAGVIDVKGVAQASAAPDAPAVLNRQHATLRLDPSIFKIDQGDLVNEAGASLEGEGEFHFNGQVDYVNQSDAARSPSFDTRGISFMLHEASTLFEATASDRGGAVFGLGDAWSVGDVALHDGSALTLVDASRNSVAASDSFFARSLSVDASSTLDLAGTRLWLHGDVQSSLEGYLGLGRVVDSSQPGVELHALYVPEVNATTLGPVPEAPVSWLSLAGTAVLGLFRLRRRPWSAG